MERRSAKSALRQIRTLYTLGALGGLTGAQLLELYLARNGDEAQDAFAALVYRHGPIVMGVCRRMLPGWHDAEDAFQAVFLILARRAASIGRREQLTSWLYGVAIRAAKEARRRHAKKAQGKYRSWMCPRIYRLPLKIEPIQDEGTQRTRHFRAEIAAEIATTDMKQALALVDTIGGNAFFHEQARTEIAYRIGAGRPDEAIKIIEGMKRDPAAIWQAEAFGWLAVALAPRDRARANSLIDRALAMMIEQRDWASRSAWSGGEMAGAAHIAACAQQISYPDMESVIMRVMAARPSGGRNGSSDRTSLIRSLSVSAVPLALIDPGAARTVLEQIEARCGLDPATLWNARGPWLCAWALVDLKKAESIFAATQTALEGSKEARLGSPDFYEMFDLLTAPPARREEVLANSSHGQHWRPGNGL